ncbi:MobF family relaxase [Caulobacter sp. 17J65-9]|uniref:MobF family relaxase n=1 Tax=Caulobacter sp. 17J65-9 TaxID=2709382 RepID=UPI0013C5C5CD|nr:MobF family relaxase [Caulobacter sp. 17J65-9]NEX91186.1 relaxase domain-containing protein [Caulobacter sp. 17J65-9]
MQSIGSVKSAGGAASYYGKDDYYVSGEADRPGLTWGGEGSSLAGLEGRAGTTQFRQVLDGSFAGFANKDPGQAGGGESGKGAAGPKDGGKHRAGWDFTFSAPKSVSVAILVGGDKGLDRAHDKANAAAMSYIEKHFSVTRVREGGTIVQRVTGNLVYGSVVHGTSRAGDPDRHTHNVVANRTFDHQTGQWRALETHHAFKHQQLTGMIYQAQLAAEGLKLGHNFVRGHTQGTFELASWSKDQMRVFSQRREQIEQQISFEKLRTGEDPSPAVIDRLVLRSRPDKEHVARSELVNRWKAVAEKNGIEVDRVIREAESREHGADLTPTSEGFIKQDGLVTRIREAIFGRQAPKQADPYALGSRDPGGDHVAGAAVSFAVRHLEQNNAVFDRHQVAFHALRAAPVGVTIDRIEAQIERLTAEKHLHVADREVLGGLTTAFAVKLEQSILGRMDAGRGAAAPIMSRAEAKDAIAGISEKMAKASGHSLTNGQARAAYQVLSTKDRYVAVQGWAGVGKTTLFSTLKGVLEEKGHSIHGVVATHEAAGVLRRETGIESNTAESWLRGRERDLERGGVALERARAHWKDRTLLVDESSLLSNASLHRIQVVTEQLGLRSVVLAGDKGQIGSVEAGSPFRLLQMAKIATTEMRDIIRQKDLGLRRAVELLADQKVHPGIRALGERVHQVGRDASDQKVAEKAVQLWKERRAERHTPPIVVLTHAMRGLVTQNVRNELIRSGELGPVLGQETRLYEARMSNAENVRADSYAVGQVVVTAKAMKNLGLARDTQGQIVGVDRDRNRLTVRIEDGRMVNFDLNTFRGDRMGFNTYSAREAEIRANEQMVWEKSDAKRGFFVGAGFTVLGRDGDKWTIQDRAGKVHQVTDKDLRFTGYGHAITADRVQGDTAINAIGVQTPREGQSVAMTRMYVQASRPKERFDLVTTDAGLLARKLAKQSGVNPSALEALRDAGQQLIQSVADRAGIVRGDEGKGLAGGRALLVPDEKVPPSAPVQDRERDFSKTHDLKQPEKTL